MLSMISELLVSLLERPARSGTLLIGRPRALIPGTGRWIPGEVRAQLGASGSSEKCQHALREIPLDRRPGIPSGAAAQPHVLLSNSLSPAAPSAKVLNALQTAFRAEHEGQMQSTPELRVTSDFTSLRIV